jgi:ComF family protein
MPRLGYRADVINPTERMLLTEKSLVRAASVLHYSKESDYRNILFHLKYWRHPQVGVWLARVGAQELIPQGFFEGIDCIVPMPITYWKEIKRGYNQCSFIAKGIRKATCLPIINNAVKCVKAHSKQAGLGKYQRWNNAQDLFAVTDPSSLQGKHVLVVDDVITTGATLCSLIDVMEEKIPNLKVSVFTLAVAD